jgi:hypothetical protein
MRLAALLTAMAAAACSVETVESQSDSAPRVFAERPRTGPPFFKVDADADGRLLVTLPRAGDDGVSLRMIHAAGLTAGVGSNPVGLDRGAAESGRIIAFRRIGDRVVIEQENWAYRARADNPAEARAVRESFARSFLWAGQVADENPGGTYTVDISGFLTGDVLDLAGALARAGQGDYALDAARSMVDPQSALAFPDNVEIDAHLTFAAKKPGAEIAAAAADGRSFTLTAHHSFVRLPEEGFRPRLFDARAGVIDSPFHDFSAPLTAPIVTRHAQRFRLERDPRRAGRARRAIVFYVDRGAPEPVRQALIDGASWWAEAFKAAGYDDAFRVELLPADAHPMDVRYNVIQWVHRRTRGWSYGGGVVDPRTGEILKGHVVLGSQRVRQDRMIFEGLAGAAKSGTGDADDPVLLSLARIRQLAAHEVGHALGLAHNFAASADGRASVMDYPAPFVRPTASGDLDFSDAYAVGIGEWDKIAARWLYTEFREGADEARGLEAILREAHARGLDFVDDAAGRGVETADPRASVWDNGEDPVAMLAETLRVREIALLRFGLDAIRSGRPTAELSAVIAPIYLYHRYQVDAAAKLIGGYQFDYSAKGDGRHAGAIVDPARQRAALSALLATLNPAALDLPDATLDLLTPEIASFSGAPSLAEAFPREAGPMFDLLAAADAAATKTLAALLHPARGARLVETERRRRDALTYEQLLAGVEAAIFAPPGEARRAEIARRVQTRFVTMLIDIAAGGAATGDSQAASVFLGEPPAPAAAPEVRLRTNAYLRGLERRIAAGPLSGFGAQGAHRESLRAMIAAHLARPAPAVAPSVRPPVIPPGPPIGGAEDCWFCEL